MRAIRLDTFKKQYNISPTWRYTMGVQGNWVDSDNHRRGRSMYMWILEEKVYESN